MRIQLELNKIKSFYILSTSWHKYTLLERLVFEKGLAVVTFSALLFSFVTSINIIHISIYIWIFQTCFGRKLCLLGVYAKKYKVLNTKRAKQCNFSNNRNNIKRGLIEWQDYVECFTWLSSVGFSQRMYSASLILCWWLIETETCCFFIEVLYMSAIQSCFRNIFCFLFGSPNSFCFVIGSCNIFYYVIG